MKKLTFTKIMVIIYSICFIVWISLSYVLAFLGRDEIAQDLSQQVVVVGIATSLGYMMKAFFETKEEEQVKLDREIFLSTSNLKEDETEKATEEEMKEAVE